MGASAHCQGRSQAMSRTLVISVSVFVALVTMPVQAQQVPNPTIAAQVPAPAPGPWTKAYVQMVGRMAYVWGWPLAVQINQRATHADVTEPVIWTLERSP